MASKPSTVRKQIRTFALVWTGITLLMGACTFAAIYLAYGALNTSSTDTSSLAIPRVTSTPAIAAAQITNTAVPTQPATQAPASPTPQASATIEQTEEASQEVAAAQIAPTLLPVDQREFQPGIQVQESPDMNPENQALWMREVTEKLHLDWIKQQVRWENIEPEKGQFDWTRLDLALPIAADHNVKVLISVVTAPDWARDQGVDLTRHGPPADPQDYVNFVTAIINRYPGMVHAIEVWNEQNIDREWTSTKGLSAANYVDLLRQTATAVKAIDPGIIMVSGALSPTGLSDGVRAWDDFQYLDQLISAGLLNYADCVGAHHNGYNIGPSVAWDNVPNDPSASFRGPFDNPHHSWSFRSTIQTYANKIQLAGGDQKLCITEFGWASTEDLGGFPAGFEFANDNTLQEQSDWLVEALNNMEEWDIVWLAFIWNLNYGPQAGWATDNDNVPYSLIGKDWAFRPAYDAIGQWQLDHKARKEQ
jgi:hypothetical protein